MRKAISILNIACGALLIATGVVGLVLSHQDKHRERWN